MTWEDSARERQRQEQPSPTAVAEAVADALRFFRALYSLAPTGSYVELRPLHGKASQEWFKIQGQLAHAARLAVKLARTDDVYMGVNPRRRQGGEAKDVACIVALVADADVGEGKPHATKADALAALGRLTALALPASLVVDSGGGFHVYWLLADPLPVAEHPRALAVMARIRTALGGLDFIDDLPRILRVPGTLNHKRGEHRPVFLVECHPELVYTIEDIEAKLLPLPVPVIPVVPVVPGVAAELATGPGRGQGARAAIPAGTRGAGMSADAWRARHDPPPAPSSKTPGHCPVCQHDGCYYESAGDSSRRTCRSTDHERYGKCGTRQADGHYLFDALDFAAWESNTTHAGVLHADRPIPPPTPRNGAATVTTQEPGPDNATGEPVTPKNGKPETPADFVARTAVAAGAAAIVSRPKPVIQIDRGELPQNVADGIAALARHPNVYQRGDALVCVRYNEKTGNPCIKVIATPTIRCDLAAAATWQRFLKSEKKWVNDYPPDAVVTAIQHAKERAGIPYLNAIARAPYLNPDGTVEIQPGYNPATGVLFIPEAEFPPVPAKPSPEDIRRAVATLRDPFLDFKFKSDFDQSASISAILSITGRPAIAGPVPLFGIRSPTPATGKGLLADTIIISATGRERDYSFTPTKANEEWRKQILTIAMEGHSVVLLDNVDGDLGSDAFASALTATRINDRLLGLNQSGGGELLTVWLSTGNNTNFKNTVARRTLVIEMDAELEFPEDRVGLKYPLLRAHVTAVWPTLAVAALTILRSYWLAGRPAHGNARVMASFEAWDALVRGACIWAGIGDPDGARERTRAETDTDRDTTGEALAAWREQFGEKPTSAVEAFEATKRNTELAAALSGLVRGPLTTRSLGYGLRHSKKRIVNGLRFASKEVHAGKQGWYVEKIGDGNATTPGPTGAEHGGDGGDGGDDSDRFGF